MVDTGSTDSTVKEAQKRGWTVHVWPEACDLPLEELANRYLPGDLDWKQFAKHGHYSGGVMRSFAAARQLSFDLAKNEHCFWLDLDDVLTNPEHLRPHIDEVFGGVRGARL